MKRFIILGMSESQRDIRRRIVDKCEEMDEHLVKIFLYPTYQSVPHWKHEVYALLHRVERQKSNNKYPKYPFIREAVSVDEDILDNYILSILDEYSNLTPIRYNTHDIIEKVICYHDWLSYKLSTDGQVLSSEVSTKIDELISR